MSFRPHISLEVADLQRSAQFYSQVFDTNPTKVYPDYVNFRLESLHLALVQTPYREGHSGTHQHFGFELFDPQQLEAWQQRVVAAGLAPKLEPAVTCCYAVANKFWLTDPDGYRWEFWVRTAEAETMHGPISTVVPCCG